MSSDAGAETEPFDRMQLLKDGVRLQAPFQHFVAYDNGGFLGVRFVPRPGGPSEAGVDLGLVEPIDLRGRKPADVYGCSRTLPETRRRGEPYRDVLPSCGAREPTFVVGSKEGLMADLTAIARMTTQRFSKNIERGVLMIWVLSQNEDHQVRFSFAPSEVFMTGDLSALGYEGHYWLLEDIARLSPGLFRRNLPVGCASRFDSAGHNHEPIRMVVHAIFERRTTTGHEMITTVDRYDEIVAANFSGAG